MDYENEEKDDNKRKSRNLSEKKRRDQFNLLVNELSSMVSGNNRKMDKSTVLKSTIAFLKNHNEVAVRSRADEIQENWKPSFLTNEEFTHLILEALDGFIIVLSSSGKIFFVSEGITSLLGYVPGDLTNSTIYELINKGDQSNIYHTLLSLTSGINSLQKENRSQRNQIEFSCYMKRFNAENQEKDCFEPIQFSGYFRTQDSTNEFLSRHNLDSSIDTDCRTLFIGTGRLQTPQLIRETSIVSSISEFSSRHSLEWKFLFLDHRAPPIIGYLPFEVLGTSGYDYYHFDDLEKVVVCHEALMQKGEGTSCFYRFLTKGQQWLWLQTRFFITYHQWNSKPEFIVCTHRVIGYADAIQSNKKLTVDENNLLEGRKYGTSSVSTPSPWSRCSKSSFKMNSNPDSPKSTRQRNQESSTESSCLPAMSPSSGQFSVKSQNSSQSRPKASCLKEGSQREHYNKKAKSLNVMSTQPQSTNYGHRIKQPKIIAPQFLNSQYVAAIPVQPLQPMIATTAFPNQTLIQPLHSSLDYVSSNVVLTSSQNQIQDQLQRKHEELKTLIQQQQEELRRVSEQLMMARFGIVPALVAPSFSLMNNGIQSISTSRPHLQNVVDISQQNDPLTCHLSPEAIDSSQQCLGNEKARSSKSGDCSSSLKNFASDTISPETSIKHDQNPSSISSPSLTSYSSQVQ